MTQRLYIRVGATETASSRHQVAPARHMSLGKVADNRDISYFCMNFKGVADTPAY